MSDTQHPHNITEPRLDNVLDHYFSQYHREKCYVGLVFQQGKRKMIQINIPAHDLPVLLQAKPSTGNDPDSGKNRPEVKGHAEEVKEYILKRVRKNKPWILGTLTANVDPSKIHIHQLGRGLCFIVIPRGVKLDITDGQHRKSAIHDLIESADSEMIGDNDFPITLVLEGDFNQCQTDFRDMAQTRSLDPSLLLSFGASEGTIGITKNLIQKVPMFYEKTERIKLTPSSKQKLIYTTNYIAKAVSYIFSGTPDHTLEDIDVDHSSEALINCFNQFFGECTLTRYIFETDWENLTVDDVVNFKNTCILGRSAGLEVLGRLLHCIYDSDLDMFNPNLISKIAQLDWSMGSLLWRDNIVRRDPNNPKKPYKISANASPIRMAVQEAKAALGWQ
ncbi:DNA sulfur modification protein DndB [Spirulina subsalsa FACHB-351]|uniref:DNA sulfur modification protein DndB n=1 Tax=Spirulina subsalsa FACHB-351 TaxID=234711 RepID=A0ABT3L0W3_9CYAN|nr:DNA sulfur modification protein DndB [Spirulina subsalsa]MCW6035149.1 DNA sulfur modification protein DndB [Spirulina subsalsa FACHB-351]